MIKATVRDGPHQTTIRFPCSETELSKRLGELGMNTENLAPVGTVTEIEPTELSVLEGREVSLDALNYLGKRIDGMDKREQNQFLAALSCGELGVDIGLKDMINLTYNLARYTLIEDSDDLEYIGRTHMLNVRGALSESEYNDSEWLAEEGLKLLESGSGIDTEYGKIYVNKDIPFEQTYNGTTFPAYWCESNTVVGVYIGYGNLNDFVELPCEDISIKKALCRLGAESIRDCKVEWDYTQDVSDEWMAKLLELEKTKDLFGLNALLKNKDIRLNRSPLESIFNNEVARRLREKGFTVSKADNCVNVRTSDGFEVNVFENGLLRTSKGCPSGSYSQIKETARESSEYCSAYEKAAPLNVGSLARQYRCIAEFNGAVLAAKYNEEYGFEFVTWERSHDGKAVVCGNYYSDYAAAKENFATRSGLIRKDRLFETEELAYIYRSVNFMVRHNGDLRFDECRYLEKLNEKISESLPAQQQNESPNMSM